MICEYEKEKRQLSIVFEQEIDHHICDAIRNEADYEIQAHLPKTVLFDFRNVSFMDSSGIGLLIGRYKHMLRLGGEVLIINATANVKRVLEMSGILKIIPIVEEVWQ